MSYQTLHLNLEILVGCINAYYVTYGHLSAYEIYSLGGLMAADKLDSWVKNWAC